MRLPKAKLREMESNLEALEQGYQIAAVFRDIDTGKEIPCGGVWDNINRKYLPGAPERQFKKNLSHPQFEVLRFCFLAMMGKTQEVCCYGARRAGKSQALFAAVLFVVLTRPGCNVFVVGLKKRHGMKIVGMVKRALPRHAWKFDGKETRLTVINGSKIYCKSARNADSDRGDSVHLLALDEAAFMAESVHEGLMPSVLDKGGFVVMVSSPNMLNWFYHKVEQSNSQDLDRARAVRSVHLSIADNVFDPGIKERAEKAKHVLSWDAYQQEILGRFLPKCGLVFPRYHEPKNKISVLPASLDLETAEIVNKVMDRKGFDFRYLVGVDYNVGLNIGIIIQINSQGHVYVIDQVQSADGPQAFGEELTTWLGRRGLTPMNCLVVADASGNYQSPEMKQYMHSNQVLRAQEFLVITPQTNQRTNPRILEKIEVMKALVCNANGDVRLYVAEGVSDIRCMFKELDMDARGRKPNLSNKYIHCFDALSYPVWFLHGTGAFSSHFQLVDRRLHDAK